MISYQVTQNMRLSYPWHVTIGNIVGMHVLCNKLSLLATQEEVVMRAEFVIVSFAKRHLKTFLFPMTPY